MKLSEILGHAERLRKTEIGLSNYATVLNDAFVIMRELTKHVMVLNDRVEKLNDPDKVG